MKLALLNCQGSGVGEYRHWNPAKALQRLGHEVFFTEGLEQSLSDDRAEGTLMHFARWADVIHIGYITNVNCTVLLAATRNYAIKQLGKSLPILMDCDDDLLNVPPYNLAFRNYAASQAERRSAIWSFRNSDALTVTTPWLSSLYADFNHHVTVLPNCVDPASWADLPVDPHRTNSEDVRILFAGGLGRKADLDLIQDALEIVMRARTNVRLFFIAMMPDWAMQWAGSPSNPMANRVFYMDSAGTPIYKRMARRLGIDIILAPVVENDFNRGKSSIKVLESPFIGAAAVCSDFETYAEVPAECVLKAETTYEWKESLLALVDDPTLRAQKVAKCREWALDVRSIDRQIQKWENCYEEALSRPVIGPDGENMKGASPCPSSPPPQSPSPLPSDPPPPGS